MEPEDKRNSGKAVSQTVSLELRSARRWDWKGMSWFSPAVFLMSCSRTHCRQLVFSCSSCFRYALVFSYRNLQIENVSSFQEWLDSEMLLGYTKGTSIPKGVSLCPTNFPSTSSLSYHIPGCPAGFPVLKSDFCRDTRVCSRRKGQESPIPWTKLYS